MKIETLKELIDQAYHTSKTLSDFKNKVLQLIDLYKTDSNEIYIPPITQTFESNGSKVPYHTLCGCNPQNGGSGLCGCTIANKMVDSDTKLNISGRNARWYEGC